MSTPLGTSPVVSPLPLTDYATYRDLALGVIGVAHSNQGLPDYFAPKPMSGSLTFGVA